MIIYQRRLARLITWVQSFNLSPIVIKNILA